MNADEIYFSLAKSANIPASLPDLQNQCLQAKVLLTTLVPCVFGLAAPNPENIRALLL